MVLNRGWAARVTGVSDYRFNEPLHSEPYHDCEISEADSSTVPRVRISPCECHGGTCQSVA